LFKVYVYAIFYTFLLIFSRYCIKAAKFTAFRGKAQKFAVASQFREFCESRDGREKFTALSISPKYSFGNIFSGRNWVSQHSGF